MSGISYNDVVREGWVGVGTDVLLAGRLIPSWAVSASGASDGALTRVCVWRYYAN